MADRPVVTVVVPVRDAAGVIGPCLDALAATAVAGPVQVIVVDDGSSDAGAAIASRHAVGATVVTIAPTGSYAARNAGIARATAPVIAFTDADCRPAPDWLDRGLDALAAGADLVAGAVVSRPSAVVSVWERYDRAVYLDQAELVAVDGAGATANLFVRAAVLDAVGAFDGSLISGGDVELCQRATAAGFRLVFEPGAVVEHLPRRSMAATWRLHRRLGAGWAALTARGLRPGARHDAALRIPLGTVVDRAAADGPALRRRHLAVPHAVAMSARWTGRVTGRP